MTLTLQSLIFYFFSATAVLSALGVVLSKNAVRSVLFLVFTFFCMAVNWMLLEAEFLAIALVLVYVGAVMVLFLFVVMMLDIEVPKMQYFVKRWPLSLAIGAIFIGLMAYVLNQHIFSSEVVVAPPPRPVDFSHVKALGQLLYSDYLIPFEVAGVVLLVAMVAAIGLTFRGPQMTKTQKNEQQIMVKKKDRLTVLKMQAEKRP